jgi:hypothetical protein
MLVAVLLAGLTVAQQFRFDAIYYICPETTQADGSRNLSYTCPAVTNSRDFCSCMWDFDQLNKHGNHYMAIGGPIFLDRVASAGNQLSYLVDKFNKHRSLSGTDAALKIIATAKLYFENSPTGMPRYFLLNEISSVWHKQADTAYINWIIEIAKTIRENGFIPVMYVQNFDPLRYTKSLWGWKELTKYAYLGLETYLNTEKIVKLKTDKERAAFMKKSYQKYVTNYGKAGVPKSKLILVEHYGNTAKGRFWGRSGVSHSNWIRIIKLRNSVFKSLKLKGVGSYGWFSNAMRVTSSKRNEYYGAYNSGAHLLP